MSNPQRDDSVFWVILWGICMIAVLASAAILEATHAQIRG